MKILEVNEHKYSREAFEGYKYRAIIEATLFDQYWTDKIDIYTTNSNKSEIEEVINSIKNKNKVSSIKLIHFTTKEQDEASSKFLEEFLKDI